MAKKLSLNELSEALTNSFTIDKYLELRRRFPGKDTAIWIVMGSDGSSPSFGMDYAYQLEEDLKRFDLSVEMFLGVLDGDAGEIDLFCLKLLEALSHRAKLAKKNPHAVAGNSAIGDAFVDFLIGALLEAVSFYGIRVPDSFQILIKYRLRLFENAIKEQRVLKHRRTMVALLMAENPTLSARGLAKRAGLSASTITRWMTDDDFMGYVKMFRAHPPR